jgi:hypothetical protein
MTMAGNDDFKRAIRDAMARAKPATIEEAQEVAARLQAQYNQRPLEDFDGLSPEQMASLMYVPFDSPHLVAFADALPEQAQAPLLMLYGHIASAIGDTGLKATARGNLPRKLVQAAAADYFPDPDDLAARVYREEDFVYLESTRRIAERTGLIRKRQGKFLLTKKGRELHAAAGAAAAYPILFRAFVRDFNWGYWDGYPELPIIQHSFLFSLRLLARHGDKPRPPAFYAHAFLRAFPTAVEEVEPDDWRSREETVRMCYELRTRRVFGLLGLIESQGDERRAWREDTDLRIRKTPLLDAWVRFRV